MTEMDTSRGQVPAYRAAPLEKAGEDALTAAAAVRADMEPCYQALALESESGKADEALEAEVSGELETLRRASASLSRALRETMELTDELNARRHDTHKSRDRKWYLPNPPANAAIDLEEKESGHFARGINGYKLMLICFVGSFAGVVVELLWCLARNGYLESRSGLVYGPFNLLYGAGAVLMSLALYRYRNRGGWLSFLVGMAVGSVLEYVCSWGQELVLGSRSWDYSGMPLNLNGRICLLYSIFWGILGVLWIKDLYPRMAKWILKIPNRAGKILTWACTIFLIVNALVTCVAVGRWSQRVKGAEAPNAFWEFVDQRFPDQRMERIFANMEFD